MVGSDTAAADYWKMTVEGFTRHRQDEERNSDREVVQSSDIEEAVILHGLEKEGQALCLRVLKQAKSDGEAGKWAIHVFKFKNKIFVLQRTRQKTKPGVQETRPGTQVLAPQHSVG